MLCEFNQYEVCSVPRGASTTKPLVEGDTSTASLRDGYAWWMSCQLAPVEAL